MKISVEKFDLKTAMNIALRAVSVKSTLPIMNNVLISADSDGITLNTADSEISVMANVPGTCIEQGKVAVEAKLFSNIVNKMPDGAITVTSNENNVVTISGRKSKFNIPGVAGDDFPEMPSAGKAVASFEITERALKNAISKSLFCVSKNDNRAVLTGEFFSLEGDKLTVVACDGFRVAVRGALVDGPKEKTGVVLPGRVTSELLKILTDSDRTVRITVSKMYAKFEFASAVIVSRLVDGDYVDIKRLDAPTLDNIATVDTAELVECVNRASVLMRDEKKPMVFNFSGGILEISMTTELGSTKEEVELIDYQGKDIRIGFNPRFILDALSAVDDESVTLEMTNPKTPCFIRNSDRGYSYMVLPVAL